MSLKEKPTFTINDAVQFCKTIFGIQTSASVLTGERDQNFLMETEGNGRYVLKISNGSESFELLEAQNSAMISVFESTALCPQVMLSLSGNHIEEIVSGDGSKYFIRLLTWLEGTLLAELNFHPASLMYDLGLKTGKMKCALSGFDHLALHRDFQWDLLRSPLTIEKYLGWVDDKELTDFVKWSLSLFEKRVIPRMENLEKCIIHNDVNDYNIVTSFRENYLIREPEIAGFIDFGDMVYSISVAELAVAVAYAVLDNPDPLKTAMDITRGYNSVNPLSDDEIAVLFSLVCIRLSVSICMSAYQQQQRPDDTYITISQEPIKNTVLSLMDINSSFAEASFRHAIGLDPNPAGRRIMEDVGDEAADFAPLLGVDLRIEEIVVFDLGITSHFIEGDPALINEADISLKLQQKINAEGAVAGIGRYDEPRLLYRSPLFKMDDDPVGQYRTIHLGIDIFMKAGTSVYAPCDSVIHSFSKKNGLLDYGHVIVLKHKTKTGCDFFTLYGHLSCDSLDGLTIGKEIKKGEQFATLGKVEENGGWTPHLHFQFITDLLDMGYNFPGVCSASEREVWKSFTPDPNIILQISHSYFPKTDPAREETLTHRDEILGKNLILGYETPLKINRGWMQFLYNENGEIYLDAFNNVPHVGHAHPEVVKAGQKQMALLNTNTRYLHDNIIEYAERLISTLPDPLKVCYFVNSASEANELALRMVQSYTGSKDMIVLESAYHGNTTSLIDISPYKHDGPGGKGAPPWVHKVQVADTYRGQFKASDQEAGIKYAELVKRVISKMRSEGRSPGGFIAETCPSFGGQIIFPAGYLESVYRYVRQAGGICIADEVQTAYGRIGTHFYAFENEGVIPDIVVLGKPIGNGHPLGALITTPEIAEAFDNGMEFFSTFGGNSVSAAIGLEVLNTVQKEDLQANALETGCYLLENLNELKDLFPVIGDVRGSGLFIGVELVRSRDTLEPATEEASFICNRLKDMHILTGTDGPWHNVLRIRPPLCFTLSDAEILVNALKKILENYFGSGNLNI